MLTSLPLTAKVSSTTRQLPLPHTNHLHSTPIHTHSALLIARAFDVTIYYTSIHSTTVLTIIVSVGVGTPTLQDIVCKRIVERYDTRTANILNLVFI